MRVMPLEGYGVLAGTAVGTAREDGTDTPHYELHLVDDAGEHWRIAVNVESPTTTSPTCSTAGSGARSPIRRRPCSPSAPSPASPTRCSA